MNRALSLSILLLGLTACPQPGNDMDSDMSSPLDDLGTTGDLAGASDLGGPGLGPPVTGTTLAFVAGGLGGPGEVDEVGSAARFRSPHGLALDGAGNLYVADYTTVRKVVLATGAVSTLAGVPGTAGGGYADGVGSAAQFSLPEGLAFYAGNLYVGDTNTYTLRRVDPATGTVTTIAGSISQQATVDGVGTAARFRQITDVVSDGAGNLYIADATCVRMMVLATGQVSTIAGATGSAGSLDGIGSAARFRVPEALALDGAGNLFVADTGNHTIRKLVLATGEVTTLAGTAGSNGSQDGTGLAARFYSPKGLAYYSGNLYVADTNNHTLRLVAVATGAVSTIAGAAGSSGSPDGTGNAARFEYPSGLRLDGAGNLYISDKGNASIRSMALGTSAVTTRVGAPRAPGFTDGSGAAARFRSPISATVDGAGNLYVADTGNYVIRRCHLPSGVVTTLAGTPGMRANVDGVGPDARFFGPIGVALDRDSLYVADAWTIRRLVLATGAVTTIAGTAGMLGTADGVGPAARFFNTVHMVGDGAGTLYVVDSLGASIRKIDVATAAVSTVISGLGGVAPNYPGLALDGAGNLYFVDAHAIRKLELATSQLTTIAGRRGVPGYLDGVGDAARFYSPQGMAIDSGGNLFLGERGVVGGIVRKVVLATGAVTTLAGLSERTGVKLGPLPGSVTHAVAATVYAGQLYLLEHSENSILVVR